MFSDKTQISSNEIIFAGSPNLIEKLPIWLPNSKFSRNQSDLIAESSSSEEKYIFVDYFNNFETPSLLTENGLLLSGKLLSKLAGGVSKGQYAQAAGQEILSIGEVTNISGSVKATRVDGNVFELNTGDPVFQGDTIETSVDGSVGLVFIDKTTFSLSEGGKMVLDELVYDPSIGSGSMSLEMLEGAFSFISGEVAKTGPDAMELKTPVVTMGIRGTTVAGKAAVEGNDNSFTLLEDSDGGVGQISISNDGGTQVLSQVGATTVVSSFTAPPPPPIILTAAQIQANYGTALNVLPPTPLVAPQPQSRRLLKRSHKMRLREEEGDEDTSEEEANEETSEDGILSLMEKKIPLKKVLSTKNFLEEETLEDESPSEGEEPLGGWPFRR